MGMSLVNQHDDRLRFTNVAWARILYLAEDYGWQPAGTVSPCDHEDPTSEFYMAEPWDGNYGSNDGQTVTADDAEAFADALEGALRDIPDRPLEIGERVRVDEMVAHADDPVLDLLARMSDEGTVPPQLPYVYECFGSDTKRKIEELVALCRKGEFYLF